MIDGAQLLAAIDMLVEEKKINRELIIEGIKEGIAKAYEKFFDPEAELEVDFDQFTGQIRVFKKIKIVKKVEDDLLEVNLKEGKVRFGEHVAIGDVIKEQVDSAEFSRLAIMQVGQILKQHIREAEKNSIYDEYISNKDEIMSGIVANVEESYILIEVGRTFAYLSKASMIPSEVFNPGEAIKFFVEEVGKTKNAGKLTASRTSTQFLTRLMEIEVPELFEKIVEIKSAVRFPGVRAKIAVHSNDDNVDPIGACIGQKGIRVNAVSKQLNGERIDLCIWKEDPQEFITNALSPVKVISINLDKIKKEASVIIPTEQFSLAVGKNGSSAKLVAQLTKWKINIIAYENAINDKIEFQWNGNITPDELTALQAKLKENPHNNRKPFNNNKRNFVQRNNNNRNNFRATTTAKPGINQQPSIASKPIINHQIETTPIVEQQIIEQVQETVEMDHNSSVFFEEICNQKVEEDEEAFDQYDEYYED